MVQKNIEKLLGSEEVTEFLWNTLHPMKDSMELLRKTNLSADYQIIEHL